MVDEPVYEAHLKHPHFQEVDDVGGSDDGEGDDGDGEGGDDGEGDDGGNAGGDDEGGDDEGGGIGEDEGEDEMAPKGESDVTTTAANPASNEHQQGVMMESPSLTPASPREAPPILAQAGNEAGSDTGCGNTSGKLLTKDELLQLFLDVSQVKGEPVRGSAGGVVT